MKYLMKFYYYITLNELTELYNSHKEYLNTCYSIDNKTIIKSCDKLLLKRYYKYKSKLKTEDILI